MPHFAKLDLGWVMIGDMCLGKVHKPTLVQTYRTSILENGQSTYFHPCPNNYNVKESTQRLAEWDISENKR